ncbi:ATP-dependent protease OS=Streptomyces alboniger OX=132473 GN=CP975_08965 PE=4 SV=1 [Streptomyces alboniger]
MTTVRLPLFPLNSVLFPGLVLPLNIFEERYRAMMRELLKTPEDASRQFAVVTIRDGHEVATTSPGLPDQTAVPERGPTAGFGDDPIKAFHGVGCIADAATVRERADGTFEVLATGTTRVRLLSVDASGPFLTAELEPLPEDPGDEAGALAEGVLRSSASTRSGWGGRASDRCPPARTCRTNRPWSPIWWPPR